MKRWGLGARVLVVLFWITFPARGDFRIAVPLSLIPPIRPVAPASLIGQLPIAAPRTPELGLLGEIARRLRPSWWLEQQMMKYGPRSVMPDIAKERQATSLGVRGASISGMGMAAVGLGLGATATFAIAKLGKKIDLTAGPTFCLGGGGARLGIRF